jgi:hypothetical protein
MTKSSSDLTPISGFEAGWNPAAIVLGIANGAKRVEVPVLNLMISNRTGAPGSNREPYYPEWADKLA